MGAYHLAFSQVGVNAYGQSRIGRGTITDVPGGSVREHIGDGDGGRLIILVGHQYPFVELAVLPTRVSLGQVPVVAYSGGRHARAASGPPVVVPEIHGTLGHQRLVGENASAHLAALADLPIDAYGQPLVSAHRIFLMFGPPTREQVIYGKISGIRPRVEDKDPLFEKAAPGTGEALGEEEVYAWGVRSDNVVASAYSVVLVIHGTLADQPGSPVYDRGHTGLVRHLGIHVNGLPAVCGHHVIRGFCDSSLRHVGNHYRHIAIAHITHKYVFIEPGLRAAFCEV